MEKRQQGLALFSRPIEVQRFLQSGYSGNLEISQGLSNEVKAHTPKKKDLWSQHAVMLIDSHAWIIILGNFCLSFSRLHIYNLIYIKNISFSTPESINFLS